MGADTKISWANDSINFWWGCTERGVGCRNCYAKPLAARFGFDAWGPHAPRYVVASAEKTLRKLDRRAQREGRPRLVFLNSMSDFFEEHHGPVLNWDGTPSEETLDSLREKALHLADELQWVRLLILTKRPENIRSMWPRPLPPGDYVAVDKEIVLPIPGYIGYHVSNYGNIYTENGSKTCLRCGKELDGMARKKYCGSACRQAMWKAGTTAVEKSNMRVLSPDVGDDGHCRVTLYQDGVATRELVHRLVLSVFVRDPLDGEQGCHRDRNPSNNRLDNLRWGTQSSNWDDSKSHGTHRRYSKLKIEDVLCIRSSGDSPQSLARRFGVSVTQIRNILREKQWIEPSFFRKNVFLGTSISTQADADRNITELLKCRDLSPVLFASAEPLLDEIGLFHYMPCDRTAENLYHGFVNPLLGWYSGREQGRGTGCSGPKLDWVIIGGESGPNARPCNLTWIRELRDQCRASSIPLYVKQLGSRPYVCHLEHDKPMYGDSSRRVDCRGEAGYGCKQLTLRDPKGGDPAEWPEDLRVREFPRGV